MGPEKSKIQAPEIVISAFFAGQTGGRRFEEGPRSGRLKTITDYLRKGAGREGVAHGSADGEGVFRPK